MENKWYAVMLDRDDNDWGYGSENLEDAMRMVADQVDKNPDAYIAVIENDVCISEIAQEDFDPVYANACEIIKAKDWDACRDALDSLMYWLGMEVEWKDADADNFEDVIRKAGKQIGIDLV